MDDNKEYGMSLEEIEDMAGFASKLFDELDLGRLTPRDIFILGFLKGRDFTLHQLGAYDDDDDDDIEDIDDIEVPEIIQKYLDYDKSKK